MWRTLCNCRGQVGETGRTLGKGFLKFPPIFISTFPCSKKPWELVLPCAGHRVFWEGTGRSGGWGAWKYVVPTLCIGEPLPAVCMPLAQMRRELCPFGKQALLESAKVWGRPPPPGTAFVDHAAAFASYHTANLKLVC